MDPKPSKTVATLVAVGSFGPAMFSPYWFKSHDLLREAEADNAVTQIVSPDITLFKTEWLEVDIRNNRIQFRTQQEPYFPVLRDLMLGCLELFPAVPVVQLGFNWDEQYIFQEAEKYHALGHMLAPKTPWGDSMKNPGMLDLGIRSERSDDRDGYKDFRVRPLIQQASNTVHVSVNDHVSFQRAEPTSPQLAIECVISYWEQSLMEFHEVATHLIKGAQNA